MSGLLHFLGLGSVVLSLALGEVLGEVESGLLFDLVKVEKRCDGAPRKFEDYNVAINKANLPDGVTIEELI